MFDFADLPDLADLHLFYQDWLAHFSEALRFDWVNVLPTSGLFGQQLPDGTWDGVVGDLNKGLLDLTNVALNHIPSRFEVHTQPPINSRNSQLYNNDSLAGD